jgi:hypothetical protein
LTIFFLNVFPLLDHELVAQEQSRIALDMIEPLIGFNIAAGTTRGSIRL